MVLHNTILPHWAVQPGTPTEKSASKALKQRQIWAIRFFLDRERRMRDRALLDLAIDSKLRGCDLVKIKIGTLVTGQEIRARARVVQQAKSFFFSSNSIAPIGRSRLSTRD